jgi:hypothetical protein
MPVKTPLRAVPPPLPHLRSVPPPPPLPIAADETLSPEDAVKTLHFHKAMLSTNEDPTALQPGALMTGSTMVKLFDGTRAIVVRIVERMRVIHDMRRAVAIQRAGTVAIQPSTPTLPKLFDTAKVNKMVVSTYKLVGFAVLTLIALALISYLGANVFYGFSSSWIEPTVISPSDERVLALTSQLAQQSSARDKVAADLQDAERVMRMHEEFLEGAKKALADELADRKSELNRLMALDRNFASTRAEVASNGRRYSAMSKQRLAAEYQSHFIDRETAVSGAMQLSQIAQGNLSLAEKDIELAKRRAELQRETDALGAAVGAKPGGRHSIEILKIVQDVKLAEVELAKARDNRVVLQKSLERYDRMVKTISDSPFVRAIDGKDTIAFVPYDNIDRVKPGAPVYGCWIGPLFCKKVGSIVALLPGEMAYKHPLHNAQLRGQPAQVQLGDVHDAERKVLFVGGRPILF